MSDQELHVFRSHSPMTGYVFRTGRTVFFINGQYATSIKSEIDEMTTECSDPTSNYYIDHNNKTTTQEKLDPLYGIRIKIREEERAALIAASGNPNRDMGETPQGKLEGISNSNSIRGASLQSGTAQTSPVVPGSIKAVVLAK